MEVFPGITMDPEIRFGKPCISGTRIDVATVLGRLTPRATPPSGPLIHYLLLSCHLQNLMVDTRAHPSIQRLKGLNPTTPR